MTSEMEAIQLVMTRECLRKQLEEYELLKSMYSNPGEFQTDNPYLINDIEAYLAGERSIIEEKLDYRIKLQMDTIKVELSVILSKNYPILEQPMLILRTDILSKHQEKILKSAIENYIETEVDKTEPYMFQVISWLQDNINELVQIPGNTNAHDETYNADDSKLLMERAWLWSHHIYSKTKRQDIIKLTKDYDLNGFMWSGKPGVICFEGISENVEDVVKHIKTWAWQKLKIVKTETANEDPDEFFRFKGFQEIMLDENEKNEKEVGRMDNSAFFKYLESHKSGYMKKELFGFE
ncbi:RWD domain-containing protein 2A [Chironomus tepperi]|uniref:RWD domain-containing protein 2A n=1 Tax=Chironomus tepperi TaxID=113505 RepID=UPI00391F7069